MGLSNIGPELLMGMASLFAHKLRSLLTMLGMIFGVGAVVAMLSITAGAQKEMMSFIDQLGVNNIIVEAHEAVDRNELQTVRAVSPGLTFRDFRAISENVSGLVAITPRKRFKPQKLLPKTSQEQPQLIGVLPQFRGDQQPEAGGGPVLHRGREHRIGAGLRARRNHQGQSAGLRQSGRQVRQGQRHLAAGDRRADPAGHRRYRRGRRAGDEPQQPGDRAAQHRDAPLRGQHQLPEGRDRRHLYEGRSGRGFDRDGQRGARHPGRHPQGRGRFHRGRARRPARSSGGGRSSSSRSS